MRAAFKIIALVLVVSVLWVTSRLTRTCCPPPPEAPSNLRSAATAAKAHYQERDRYETRIDELGFTPERGNRYAYYLAAEGPLVDRAGAEVMPCPDCVGVQVDSRRHATAALHATYAATGCPLTTAAVPPFEPMPGPGVRNPPAPEAWLFAAAGNVDDDPTLDCWSIASYDRLDAAGEVIPSGKPFQEQADREPPGVWEKFVRGVL